MPTYEYECQSCHHHFEQAQNMSDAALTKCPKCNGKLERLIGGGVGIIVKGGNGGRGPMPECGDGACGMDPTAGPCCGGEGPCDTPPCMS